MATGISAFTKTLIGRESPAGTGNPTTYWRGIGILKDKREVTFPKERLGKLGGTLRSYTAKTGSELTLEGDVAFEKLPYVLDAAFYNVAATTDSGSSKIRQWSAQISSTDLVSSSDLATICAQTGDNIAVEQSQFHFVSEYTLSGKAGEAVQISAILPGRSPSTSASFAAVADTDFDNPCETIYSSMGSLYIDPSSDTPGTTLKSATILDWSLKHTTGWAIIPAMDGRTDFGDIKHVDDEILLDVTFEHNANAETERDAWKNESERVLRLNFAGSALTSTDTYSTKLLRLDLYGKWVTFGSEGLEEQDGDNIYRGTYKVAATQHATTQKKFDVLLVTEVGTLP